MSKCVGISSQRWIDSSTMPAVVGMKFENSIGNHLGVCGYVHEWKRTMIEIKPASAGLSDGISV